MKFGKARIEDGNIIFNGHVVTYTVPIEEILWAYMEKEGNGKEFQEESHFLVSNVLTIITSRRKKYSLFMTEQEGEECIRFMRAFNPEMAVGNPRGGRIEAQGLYNTRDRGGLETLDGRHVLPGRLLSSSDLYHLSIADQQMLEEEYHLKKVIDLRSTEEMKERPDTMIPGVEYYHLPVLDEKMEIPPYILTVRQALSDEMSADWKAAEDFYEFIAGDGYALRQYARFLDIILDTPKGAVLWHGGIGKDRTGIASALLYTVLGVPRKVLREDYVRTGTFLQNEKEHMYRYLESTLQDQVERAQRLDQLFSVTDAPINRFFYKIALSYPSVPDFINRALLLPPKAVQEMKDRYLL